MSKTIVKHEILEIYKYNELSESAKEKAKENYLNIYRNAISFQEIYKEELKELFPKSKLNIQFDLSYCQGDGLNIYGDLDLSEVLEIEEIKNKFSDKEYRTIKFYLDNVYYYYKLKENIRYSYCIIQNADIEEFIFDNLQGNYYKNINYKLIKKFADFGKQYLIDLCSDFEKFGYDYFYKVDDSAMEELEEDYLTDGSVL